MGLVKLFTGKSIFHSAYRKGWTFKCCPEVYPAGSLLKGTAIPKALKLLPADEERCAGCADGARCDAQERTCTLRNCLHITDGAVLLPAKHIWINQHAWNGFWVVDQLLQHFYIRWYCCMSWCTPRLHPLHSFSLDREDFISVSILSHSRAEPPPVTWMNLLPGATTPEDAVQ